MKINCLVSLSGTPSDTISFIPMTDGIEAEIKKGTFDLEERTRYAHLQLTGEALNEFYNSLEAVDNLETGVIVELTTTHLKLISYLKEKYETA